MEQSGIREFRQEIPSCKPEFPFFLLFFYSPFPTEAKHYQKKKKKKGTDLFVEPF
jgi:hypothetical protein